MHPNTNSSLVLLVLQDLISFTFLTCTQTTATLSFVDLQDFSLSQYYNLHSYTKPSLVLWTYKFRNLKLRKLLQKNWISKIVFSGSKCVLVFEVIDSQGFQDQEYHHKWGLFEEYKIWRHDLNGEIVGIYNVIISCLRD